MKKKYYVGAGLLIVIVLAAVFIARTPNSAEAIVYETEVEDSSECTSYETYDAERKVCFFECANEKECDEIAKAVDAEYEELLAALQSDSAQFTEKEPTEDTVFTARYNVGQDEKITPIEGDDRQEFRSLWSEIAKLSPDNISNSYIEEFVLYEDASDDTLAYVVDDDADGKWQYGINYATHTQSTKAEQTATLIHELAHIITLNTSQVSPDTSNCQTYKTDEGCALPSSYLNAFVAAFWKDKNQTYKPDLFVTEYAATNPEEDMAESFAFYVLSSDKTGTLVKDKKVQFFAAYPTLVEIRQDMRSVLSRSVVRERQAN